MKKKIIFGLLFLGLMIGAGARWVDTAAADEEAFAHPWAARIAERFGLNEAEVNEFFGEVHQERQAEMQARWQERINQAVADGVLTQAQAEALIARHSEMEQNRGQARDEMEAWMEENGLDHETLREYLGGPFGGGHGPGGRGMRMGG